MGAGFSSGPQGGKHQDGSDVQNFERIPVKDKRKEASAGGETMMMQV